MKYFLFLDFNKEENKLSSKHVVLCVLFSFVCMFLFIICIFLCRLCDLSLKHFLASISGNCPMCRMHIYITWCTCASLNMFGIYNKGICSKFPCVTVGILEDRSRGEKVRLRLIGRKVCKEVERRNNEREKERKRRGWKGGL